ncbi:MXRA8 protein, partial [Erithacus rubecula]|nr:MXRA8 protein [Erithacus rubecula]
FPVPASASNPSSVVVSVLNISAALGSQAVLPCQSHRMVWTQDRLKDRQRVVHWDLLGSQPGDSRMERLCDMYSAGEQRVYSSYNRGRILMPHNAFADGNFSLVIKGVAESDEGTYSCNLHHHYCHLYETVKVQLIIAKTGGCGDSSSFSRCHRSLGQQHLLVTIPTLCKNPGIKFPFCCGTISSCCHQCCLQLCKWFSGLELRIFSLAGLKSRGFSSTGHLEMPEKQNSAGMERGATRTEHLPPNSLFFKCLLGLANSQLWFQSVYFNPLWPDLILFLLCWYPTVVRGHNVINVIIPESRLHFFQQLGYILATLLLFLILLIIVVLLTRRRRQRGEWENTIFQHYSLFRKDVNLKEFTVDTTDLSPPKSEDIRLDYKNNILKEKAEQARSFPAKNIDLDK